MADYTGVMRHLAYRRISLATEASGSLEKQKHLVESWVSSQGGDPQEIVWFTDESVSGSKVGIRRPGREGLLGTVAKGDTVVVTKIDRLARSVKDLLDMVEHFKAVGASVVFVEDNIQTSGPYGNFMLTLLAAIAQLEAEITGERIKGAFAYMRKNGRHPAGSVPFGWQYVPREGGGYEVEVDPEKGPILREAILNVLNGASQHSEANRLGISGTGMSRLMHSPRLAGMIPEGDGVVTDDRGLPLVSEKARLLSPKEYAAVQDYLGEKRKTPSALTEGYPSVLFCPGCGHRMYLSKYGGKGSGRDRYKCSVNRTHQDNGGLVASILRDPVDNYLEFMLLNAYGANKILAVEWSPGGGQRDRELERVGVAIDQATMMLTQTRSAESRAEAAERLQELLAERDRIEELPVTSKPQLTPLDKTVGDWWNEADDQARSKMLASLGGWWVDGGRKGPDQRLRFDPELAVEGLQGVPTAVHGGVMWVIS